jgi:hypothetical protein
MSSSATVASLRAHLADLAMPGGLEVLESLLAGLDQGSLGPAEAMERLLAAQVTLRRERRLISAMRSSLFAPSSGWIPLISSSSLPQTAPR